MRLTVRWSRISIGHLAGLLLVLAMLFGGGPALAQSSDAGVAPNGSGVSPIGTRDFRYNDRHTTRYGTASADIVLKPSNFLACHPGDGASLAFGLCFYSGPAVATGNPGNPVLPCILSKDGRSADCTCYKLTAEPAPALPYLIDINAILNLDVYLASVKACGHDGKSCGRHDSAPACKATNAGQMMPWGDLISVFSTAKAGAYSATAGQTSCSAGKYAGCMTAPCRDTGKTDSAGNPLVECRCPVTDGPYQIGQANMPCDANALTQSSTGPAANLVWSAGYSPKAK
jgi:hypothetical protein